MSYCRFGEADVYVYDSVQGWFECCACLLKSEFLVSFTTKTRSRMIAHLEEHIAEGHIVPTYVIERLQAEIETEGDEWRGEGSDGS